MPHYIPICVTCIYLDKVKTGGYCKAFPEGIPDEILNGSDRHFKPVKGQTNSIVYKKA